MIEIDIAVDGEAWGNEKALHHHAQSAIEAAVAEAQLTLPEQCEVSLVFSDDTKVHMLNREWRQKDKPTNVLSFASNDGIAPNDWSPLLGDIIFARETVAREAAEQGKTFDAHLTHLIVHGFLHLLGHDHESEREAEMMEQLERQILARLGIADPY